MRGRISKFLGIGAAVLGCAAAVVPVPAAAQTSYSPYAESAAAALARYVRTLASSPRDFSALVGAGRAALALGDTQAAAGFFARADEVSPRSPLPHAGMGAVEVAEGRAAAALPHFARAQQLGAPVATFGADRGLAYDLLGQQAQAQADYRAALGGLDGDEARRRLALSLAISGKKAEALETLAPLQARGDSATGRIRAFVLALSGDSAGAMIAIDAAMPGSWSRVAPFLQQLPGLQPAQKAAAVNLGIFPDAGAAAYAAAPPTTYSTAATTVVSTPVAPPSVASPINWRLPSPSRPSQAAATLTGRPAAAQAGASAVKTRKVWLQLASGHNPDALPAQFRRITSRDRELFDGIRGYVAKSPDRARLVIGPFRGASDAKIFAQDLETIGVDAFSWTNSESDTIVPLGTE